MDTLSRQMRRAFKLLPEERAWEILRKAEFCVLSTVSEDGWPYGFPISTILRGESLYFHCALAPGHKIDNFAHDSRACLTAVEHIDDTAGYHYESAIAYGRMRRVADDAERVRIFEAINARWDPLANDGSSVSSYARTDVWALDVEKLTAKFVNHVRRKASDG